MPRPVYFAIPAQDPPPAPSRFYEKVFGWKFSPRENASFPYWQILTGEGFGIDGGFMLRRLPNQPCVNTVSVADIDATIATLENAGAQGALPKMAVPTVGWLVYYKDPDGHVFGVMQLDPAAK